MMGTIIANGKDNTLIADMTADDAIDIFELANQDSIRKASFNQKKIELSGHKEWFKRKLEDKSAVMLKSVTNGQLSGQVRLDIEDHIALIGVSVSDQFRGKGIGSELLQSAIKRAQEKGVKIIEAYIKPENTASIKLFEKNGWVYQEDTEVSGVKAKKYIYEIKTE